MLVLSRRKGEAVRIGQCIRLRVVSIGSQQVRLAIEAPPDVALHREEVFDRIAEANREAARSELPGLGEVPSAEERSDQTP